MVVYLASFENWYKNYLENSRLKYNMKLAEIRIPTYKRPDLLKRALKSLIAQDYSYWQAIVMDDSPAQEAKPVVESFADERIIYSPNPRNLGSSGNLDRAFTTHSLLGGIYACVLEDDNWLMPNYLSANISSLKTSGLSLLLRNQQIWIQTEQTAQQTGRTTRGDWFIKRKYTPCELHAHLFWFEGASNGGLFWKTSIKTNFQIGAKILDAGLQEYCRTFQIEDCLFFEPEPLCCWSEMSSSLSLRNAETNRVFGRGTQSIKMKLLQKYGLSVIEVAEKIAHSLNKISDLELSLLDALLIKYQFHHVSRSEIVMRYFKSLAKYLLIEDPLKEYFFEKKVS